MMMGMPPALARGAVIGPVPAAPRTFITAGGGGTTPRGICWRPSRPRISKHGVAQPAASNKQRSHGDCRSCLAAAGPAPAGGGGARPRRGTRLAPVRPGRVQEPGGHEEVLPREDALEQPRPAHHGDVPQAHRAEQLVAARHRRVLQDRVARAVHEGPQVDAALELGLAEARPRLLQASGPPPEPLEVHHRSGGRQRPPGLLEDGAAAARRLGGKHPLEHRPPREAEVAARGGLGHGEGVVAAPLELGEERVDLLDGLQRHQVRGHHVPGPQVDVVLLRPQLHQWDLAELDEHVVDALVECAADQLGHEGGHEEGEGERLVPHGLHEDHRQGDRNPGHARQQTRGSQQRVPAEVLLADDAEREQLLPEEPPQRRPGEERGQEDAARDAEAEGPAACEEVGGRQHHEAGAVERLVRGEELLDDVGLATREEGAHSCLALVVRPLQPDGQPEVQAHYGECGQHRLGPTPGTSLAKGSSPPALKPHIHSVPSRT
mmetsp:Transcript_9132/g.25673  ORF Transcript_9132/g.25673 Transcript_9132/m.25673 type:complete len:491 (-) Transcript_9132:1170-2642(-)